MTINDFFHPLNTYNILIFTFAFFVFDSIGVNFAYFLKFPGFLRPVFWIYGLGLFVFIWFLLHFYLPFDAWYILITLLFAAIISFPVYFKQKGPLILFSELIKFPIPFIFILPVIAYMLSIISLPPYISDELAYHYYSINTVFINPAGSWNFPQNIYLYPMLPRFLETGYILFFSLTKTYAVARLLHFLIFFSSIFSIAIFLRKNLNIISAAIYVFLVLFLQGLLLIESTFGHIDAGAAALTNLTLITVSGYLLTKQKGYAFAAAGLFGLAIGIKYTIFTFLIAVVLAGLILIIMEKSREISKILQEIKRKSFLLKQLIYFSIILFLVLIFGGYWYIKNYFVTGNPIYPFLFACKNNISCAVKSEFFSGWRVALDINNFETIKNELFQNNNNLFIAMLVSLLLGLVFSFLTKNKILKILSLIIPLTISIEIIISRPISGFLLRYYYHWVILIPLALSLPFVALQKIKKPFYAISVFALIIYCFFLLQTTLPMVLQTIPRINTGYYIQGDERIKKYAERQIPTEEWVEFAFPKMGSIAKWCGVNKPRVNIYYSDPKIIWFNGYEGGIFIYLVNCDIINIGILSDDNNADSFISSTGKTNPVIYYMSVEKCNPIDPPKYDDPEVKKQYEANQRLVCRGEEILKNLYIIPTDTIY